MVLREWGWNGDSCLWFEISAVAKGGSTLGFLISLDRCREEGEGIESRLKSSQKPNIKKWSHTPKLANSPKEYFLFPSAHLFLLRKV